MHISGLNHITLAVSDLDKSVVFYQDLLSFELKKLWTGGAYVEVGSLWFSLSSDVQTRQAPHPDYTHFAFSVSEEDFEPWVERLTSAGVEAWKNNRSEGQSFYFLDPDGHKLELHVGNLQSRLDVMG